MAQNWSSLTENENIFKLVKNAKKSTFAWARQWE
jgi:hypothetical protein